MKKNKYGFKYLLIAFALFFSLFNTGVITLAEGEDEQTTENEMGQAYIKALYSSDITPSEGDIFIITYRITGYTDDATIKLDASAITETPAELNMPVADYMVTGIEYLGSNEQIIEQGYGSLLFFNSRINGGLFLYLSVGNEKNAYLEDNYHDTFIVDEAHSEYGPTNDPNMTGRFENPGTSTDANTDNQTTEYQYTTEDLDFDMEYDDNYGVQEQIQDGLQEPEIEYYDTEEEEVEVKNEEKPKGNKGGVVFGFVLIGGVVVFLVWMKKHS